jgi:hypothetical protein
MSKLSKEAHKSHNGLTFVLVGDEVKGLRWRYWEHLNKQSKFIIITVVLVILMAIILALTLFFVEQNHQKQLIEAEDQISALQRIESDSQYDQESSKKYIEQFFDITYKSGGSIGISKANTFEKAYALALSFGQNKDSENTLEAYKIADSKLNKADINKAYRFYYDYGLAAVFAQQYQLAANNFTKAKEYFLQTEMAKSQKPDDIKWKNAIVQKLDNAINNLNQMAKN